MSNVGSWTGADKESLKSNLTAVLSGGLDTTATQLLWIMQVVAAEKDIQEQLANQIHAVVGNNPITYDTIAQIPLGSLSF